MDIVNFTDEIGHTKAASASPGFRTIRSDVGGVASSEITADDRVGRVNSHQLKCCSAARVFEGAISKSFGCSLDDSSCNQAAFIIIFKMANSPSFRRIKCLF